MGQVRLYNDSTGRWEWFAIQYVRMPWERIGTRLRAFLRHVRRHTHVLPDSPTLYGFDPVTLNMRDPKMERRRRRRDRLDRLTAKAANALNSMIDMQKHIG